MKRKPLLENRERASVFGTHSLSDAECLQIILQMSGISTQEILTKAGGMEELSKMEPREMVKELGLTTARAYRLSAAFSLAERVSRARHRPGSPIRSGADIARLVLETTRFSKREHFLAFYLDTRHRLIRIHQASVGTLNSSSVHPREIFNLAVRLHAQSLVIAHNHPSGDSRPSSEDKLVTERLRQAGDLVGIELIDHVVVGKDSYFSFADETTHPLP